MHPVQIDRSAGAKAAIAGVVANVILGASSVYWKILGGIPPQTLLCYRILISLVTLGAALALLRGPASLVPRISLGTFLIHAAAALFVVVNWGAFIWASVNGHVLESGLGYLLAPFVTIAVGAFVFRERMSRTRITGFALIVAAAGFMLEGSGELSHWVYLTIAATWGGYACLKKWTKLDSLSGLFVETGVLVALLPILLLISSVEPSIPVGTSQMLLALLALCGLVSVVPLSLFSFAASRLPLSVMGLFQFVLPTTQLVVAITIYEQPISHNSLVCFTAIWLSLGLIVAEPLHKSRASKHAST